MENHSLLAVVSTSYCPLQPFLEETACVHTWKSDSLDYANQEMTTLRSKSTMFKSLQLSKKFSKCYAVTVL